jgi:hypothetical protein
MTSLNFVLDGPAWFLPTIEYSPVPILFLIFPLMYLHYEH